MTDKGSAFVAKDFEDYYRKEKIELHLTTTATPRGNGQVGRIFGIVKPTIAKLPVHVHDPKKWFQQVGRVQLAINSVISRSTGKAPLLFMFGVKMKNPEDAELKKVLEEELIQDFDDYRSAEREDAIHRIAKVQQ